MRPCHWGRAVATLTLLGLFFTPPVVAAGPPASQPDALADNPWFELFPRGWERALKPLKKIPLADDLSLSFGGQARWRMESSDNRDFNDERADKDTFHLLRVRLNGRLDMGKLFTAFVEGQWTEAFMHDADPDPTSAEDRVDLSEFWLEGRDLLGTGWAVRAGRQRLWYADGWLVATPDWGNVAPRFDAVRLYRQAERFDVDLWWARPLVVEKNRWNDWKQEEFLGLWVTHKGPGGHRQHAFALAKLNFEGVTRNERSRYGDDEIYTLGLRADGQAGDWDYVVQPAVQVGRRGGMDHLAFAFRGVLGHTWRGACCRPRLAVEYNFASGDRDPNDGDSHTFDPMYPCRHDCLGYLDLVGNRNIHDVKVELSAKPCRRLTLLAAGHLFYLDARQDALYTPSGGASLRDSTGGSGRFVGAELDLLAKWKVNDCLSFLAGYSHLLTGGFIDSQPGRGSDPDFLYVAWQVDF